MGARLPRSDTLARNRELRENVGRHCYSAERCYATVLGYIIPFPVPGMLERKVRTWRRSESAGGGSAASSFSLLLG